MPTYPNLFDRMAMAAIATMALLMAGCMTYAPSKSFIGLTRAEAISRLGNPNPMPSDLDTAQRLDFPRGPFGKHTYSVYFDERGKVANFRQLLSEENFAKIVRGMDASDVVTLIGVSKDRFMLARDRGYVWNYRYETPLCFWFQIEFTLEDKVRSTGYSKPPECRLGRLRLAH